MKWFKFYGQDYLSDPKMLALSACERSCWITLLAYASVNDNGKITYLSEDQLLSQSGLHFENEEWDKTRGVLKKLESLDMIHIDNGVITIKNWQKRQETNLTSYERVKRFREKKRNDNVKITLDKNRRDKKRVDIIENEASTHETINPVDFNRDFFNGGPAFKEVLEKFRELKVEESKLNREVKKFCVYWTEPNKSGTKVKWEMESTFDVTRRLYTWLDRSKDFNKFKQERIVL